MQLSHIILAWRESITLLKGCKQRERVFMFFLSPIMWSAWCWWSWWTSWGRGWWWSPWPGLRWSTTWRRTPRWSAPTRSPETWGLLNLCLLGFILLIIAIIIIFLIIIIMFIIWNIVQPTVRASSGENDWRARPDSPSKWPLHCTLIEWLIDWLID